MHLKFFFFVSLSFIHLYAGENGAPPPKPPLKRTTPFCIEGPYMEEARIYLDQLKNEVMMGSCAAEKKEIFLKSITPHLIAAETHQKGFDFKDLLKTVQKQLEENRQWNAIFLGLNIPVGYAFSLKGNNVYAQSN